MNNISDEIVAKFFEALGKEGEFLATRPVRKALEEVLPLLSSPLNEYLYRLEKENVRLRVAARAVVDALTFVDGQFLPVLTEKNAWSDLRDVLEGNTDD